MRLTLIDYVVIFLFWGTIVGASFMFGHKPDGLQQSVSAAPVVNVTCSCPPPAPADDAPGDFPQKSRDEIMATKR